MIVINPDASRDSLSEVLAVYGAAKKPVALTGAGISVGSGIADFRSPGGLWSVFAPDEFATLEVFIRAPEKAWELYRALGCELIGKTPNAAHRALAELELNGLLDGVVTQNVDNLHQQAGSRIVLEIHGDHQHLQCLQCGGLIPVTDEHYQGKTVPLCPSCKYPLKPNVVLFGEPIRSFVEIETHLADCDLLLVIGTSAQVYPAAGLPVMVKQNGGKIFEFNQEPALGFERLDGTGGITDFFFCGDVVLTLPLLTRALL